MTNIEQSIDVVRRVHERLGGKELARRSGVPYTTIREAHARGFTSKPLETLIKLSAAAEKAEAEAAAAV